jgi:hypothetical protein
MARRFAIRSLGFVATLALSSPAFAHVRMDYPLSRYPDPGRGGDVNADLKDGPCGRSNDERTTDESRVTTLEAGATITVEFRETVAHTGWYRIAFLEDGQEFPEPPTSGSAPTSAAAPILLDGIPDGERGMTFTAEVTLPNTPCTNCTLQLIQVMTDRNPYTSYYVCADLILTGGDGAGGTGGAGGAAGAGGGGGMPGGGGDGGKGGGAGMTPVGGTGSGVSGAGGGGSGSGFVPAAGMPGTGGARPGAGGMASAGTPGSAGSQATAGTGTSGTGTTGSGGSSSSAGSTSTGTGGAPPASGDTSEAEGGCSMSRSPRAPAGLALVALGFVAGFVARRRRRSRAA